jgi:monoterpene epsilon-lactone hydrolase
VIDPPEHLSSGAMSYLLDPDVLAYPTDWTDAWSVHEFRNVAHPLWCSLNDSLDFDYSAVPDVLGDVTSGGVAVERISVGQPRSDVALLHLHGGMYCLGTPEIDRVLNAPIARATGAEIFSVDYRLAPEHPFPAAVEDAISAYTTLVDAGRTVVIFGESAGGGLAAATTIAIRDAGMPIPSGLVLMSPMLDLTGSSDTYQTLTRADPDYADTTALLAPAAAYAGDHALDHPLVSPLFADLAGLPPTLLQVGGREVLLGDAIRFAQAMRRAGGDITLDIADGCWHNYQLWYGVAEADRAIAQVADFVIGALS